MRIPDPPPAPTVSLFSNEESFFQAWKTVDVIQGDYRPWDEMQFRTPPAGLTHQEWWTVTAAKRRAAARELPLRRLNGERFWFTLPDEALRALTDLASRAGGTIGMREAVTTASNRHQYLVRGLMDEAITSSQLEGATTTRRVAKDMLRSGRAPRTPGERMIANNYAAMQYVQEHRTEPISPAAVRELHAILVDGTLENPADAGRLQEPGEERIHIGTHDGRVVHRPPEAAELAERLDELCTFANGNTGGNGWLPPVARAIFTHFMAGHDHYFVDGNGRLARTLFYWVMLKEGYWLTEFVTISTILKGAQAQYGRAYLNSEYEGDATFFLLHHLTVLSRAFDALEEYLKAQTLATQEFKRSIASDHLGLNHRQVAILERALHDRALDLTLKSHATSHHVSVMTARADLHDLEARGLLTRHRVGREHHWWPIPNLPAALAELQATSP